MRGEERAQDLTAYRAVQTAHSVNRPASANREIGHVERLVRILRVEATEGQEPTGPIPIRVGVATQKRATGRGRSGRSPRRRECES